ncbi:hypothetical protein HMPREF1986_02386 [Oribacterium sp. oral taxon 078 str. F0263]|nr:hypothetical protein HMPREF1986_02386 [Oribacterium sp. oral taxon 078 str. F0263]
MCRWTKLRKFKNGIPNRKRLSRRGSGRACKRKLQENGRIGDRPGDRE